jgi:hypothetical protein
MNPRWIKCQICESNIGSNNERNTEMIKIFFLLVASRSILGARQWEQSSRASIIDKVKGKSQGKDADDTPYFRYFLFILLPLSNHNNNGDVL